MKTLSKYQEDIKALLAKAKEIEAKAATENRDPSPAELEKSNELMGEAEYLRGIVATLQRRERIDADLETPDGPVTRPGPRATADASRSQDRFGTLGEQLIAVARAELRQGTDPRLFRAAAAGLNESVPSDGGFLVQQDFSTVLLEQTFATGLLPARCRRIQISSNANSVKLNGVDETSRASTRFGGVLAYWLDEAGAKTESKPKFRQITLDLKKLIGMVYATDELLADASALESYIRRAFPAEFGFKLDDAIINGTGAGMPLGILNGGCLVTVSKESGQAADTVVAENIWKMYARMFPASVGNAVWLINQAVWPQLFQLSLSVGTGGGPLFVPAGGIAASPYNTLLGRPVIPVEQCSAIGDLGDIIFADFGGYLLAEKGGIESAMSIHVKFTTDESVFRFVLRIDGQPERASALTPYKGGSGATLSHFVTLEAR
jgi:HK97 family phage major capsid protein